MTNYTARATWGEGWWGVWVDEVPGLFTQTRTLNEIPGMVRDALTLFPELEDNPKEATINIQVEGEPQEAANKAAAAKQAAEDAKTAAAQAMRDAATTMRNQGLGLKDIAQLLGVTKGRVHQILKTN